MLKRTEWLSLEYGRWRTESGRVFLCDRDLRKWATIPEDTKCLRACFSDRKPTSNDDWVAMRTKARADMWGSWVLVYLSAPDAAKASRGELVPTGANFDRWLTSHRLDNVGKMYAWIEVES